MLGRLQEFYAGTAAKMAPLEAYILSGPVWAERSALAHEMEVSFLRGCTLTPMATVLLGSTPGPALARHSVRRYMGTARKPLSPADPDRSVTRRDLEGVASGLASTAPLETGGAWWPGRRDEVPCTGRRSVASLGLRAVLLRRRPWPLVSLSLIREWSRGPTLSMMRRSRLHWPTASTQIGSYRTRGAIARDTCYLSRGRDSLWSRDAVLPWPTSLLPGHLKMSSPSFLRCSRISFVIACRNAHPIP